jgi:hypothetical protein
MADAKQPKFAIVPAAVVTDPRLSNAAKVVYQSLALHAGKDRKCIPSRALIASYQGIDRSAVRKSLRLLVDAGYIEIRQRERGNGSLTSNEYLLKGWCPEDTRVVSSGHPHNIPINKPIEHKGAAPENDDVKIAVEKWNAMAKEVGLQVCQNLTAPRRKGITARLKDAGGIGGWMAALDKVKQSPFCLKKARGNKGITIDFLRSEDNFTKLMEGSYDGDFDKGKPGPPDLMEIVQAAMEPPAATVLPSEPSAFDIIQAIAEGRAERGEDG